MGKAAREMEEDAHEKRIVKYQKKGALGMKQKRIVGMLLVVILTLVSVFGNLSTQVYASSKVRLNQRSLTMTLGGTYSLKVKSLPPNAKVTWTSSDKRKATVSPKGVVKAKKAGTVVIRSRVVYRQNGKKKTAKRSSRIRIRNYKSVEGQKIKMTTKNAEVIITLNGSKAAADLVSMLPLELRLIERNGFAKGMTLPKPLSSKEATTRDYEIGDFGYWNDGPDLAIFYDDIYAKTIVRVIPLGHAESGAEVMAHERGKVRLELVK